MPKYYSPRSVAEFIIFNGDKVANSNDMRFNYRSVMHDFLSGKVEFSNTASLTYNKLSGFGKLNDSNPAKNFANCKKQLNYVLTQYLNDMRREARIQYQKGSINQKEYKETLGLANKIFRDTRKVSVFTRVEKIGMLGLGENPPRNLYKASLEEFNYITDLKFDVKGALPSNEQMHTVVKNAAAIYANQKAVHEKRKVPFFANFWPLKYFGAAGAYNKEKAAVEQMKNILLSKGCKNTVEAIDNKVPREMMDKEIAKDYASMTKNSVYWLSGKNDIKDVVQTLNNEEEKRTHYNRYMAKVQEEAERQAREKEEKENKELFTEIKEDEPTKALNDRLAKDLDTGETEIEQIVEDGPASELEEEKVID